MSIGNLKDSGNQGNNMPWQWQVLKGLQAILDEVAQPLACAEDSVTICSPAAGLNVNVHDGAGTAITSTSDLLGNTGLDVNIIGGVSIEVNLDALDDQVGIYGYTDVNDPTSVKAVSVDTNGYVNTNASVTFPSSFPVTQDPASNPWTVDASDLDIRDLAFATDKVDVSGSSVSVSNFPVTQPVSAASLPLPTGAATETTLVDIKTSVQLLDDCVGTDNTTPPTKSLVIAGITAGGVTQQTIEVSGSGHVHIADGGGSITVDSNAAVRTPTFLRPTLANGTITLGSTYSMSFASVGTGNAIVGTGAGTIILKPGETLNFDAGAINNTLGAVTYDTLTNAGAELIIITLT